MIKTLRKLEELPQLDKENLQKTKIFCESDDNHNEQQKDEHEDVKENIKIIKCRGGE